MRFSSTQPDFVNNDAQLEQLIRSYSSSNNVNQVTHLQLSPIKNPDRASTQSHINDAFLEIIAATFPNLVALDCRLCDQIGDAGIDIIASRFKSISSLNLQGLHKVTDAGIEKLGQLESLREINLENCHKITDSALAKLPRGLQVLDLSLCDEVTDEGLFLIGKNLKSLSSLNLRDLDKITDEGIFYLVSALPNLQSLNLRNTQITDASLKFIAEKCTSLSHLGLYNCHRITDKGLLDYLSKMSSLSTIDLTLLGDEISDEAKQAFKRSNPNCKLIF